MCFAEICGFSPNWRFFTIKGNPRRGLKTWHVSLVGPLFFFVFQTYFLMSESRSKFRGFTFTLFEYEASWPLIKERISEKAVYWICGKEVCPDTGRPHLQGYLYLKNPVTWRHVAESLFRKLGHIESAKGDSAQNFAYCSKGGDYEEFGVRPLTQQEKGAAGKTTQEARWAEMNALARTGNFALLAEQFPRESTVYRAQFQAVLNDSLGHRSELKTCAGVWIVGESNAGKSSLARAVFKDRYLKGSHKWWSNYRNQPAAIWDDLGLKAAGEFSDDLKRYGDRWEFEAEVKNGNLQAIRPLWFVVTTQYEVNEMWSDPETRAAMHRRYKVIRISEDTREAAEKELRDYVATREAVELDEDMVEIVPAASSPRKRRRVGAPASEAVGSLEDPIQVDDIEI